MAASPYALEKPAHVGPQPENIGTHKEITVDVVWTSNNSNLTADATIEAADVGLNVITGAVFLGDVGAAYAGDDTVGTVDCAVDTNGDLTVSGLSAAGVALDLDNTDVAAARLAIRGY